MKAKRRALRPLSAEVISALLPTGLPSRGKLVRKAETKSRTMRRSAAIVLCEVLSVSARAERSTGSGVGGIRTAGGVVEVDGAGDEVVVDAGVPKYQSRSAKIATMSANVKALRRSTAGETDQRKPRLGLAKRPMLGRTVERSVALTPNQVARVAAYSSTLVVGIQRPRPVSSGPLTVSVGILP